MEVWERVCLALWDILLWLNWGQDRDYDWIPLSTMIPTGSSNSGHGVRIPRNPGFEWGRWQLFAVGTVKQVCACDFWVYARGLCVRRIKSSQVNPESSPNPFIKPLSSIFSCFLLILPEHSARTLSSTPLLNWIPILATDSTDSQLSHDLWRC